MSGSERGRSSTGVWTRYCGTAAKAGGKQRTQTSSCSSGRLQPTRREVYRARDTKLGRDVAIKVLPEEFSRNAERLARFDREAKLLASLNHSGIATLHAFEEDGGTRFLVMELVEGETLAERIARGPMSWDEASPIFLQIAEALEAAHEKGIVHRDLKPANVMITPEGKIKILDFGLAKMFLEEAPSDEASQSPTRTRGAAFGVILGTASYMSNGSPTSRTRPGATRATCGRFPPSTGGSLCPRMEVTSLASLTLGGSSSI